MAAFNPTTLKSHANEKLCSAQQDYRRLVLIHTGIVIAISLLGSGLNIFLDYRIGDTGGLGGLGIRSMLQTVQAVLEYGTMFFTPFWQASFIFLTLQWAAGHAARPSDLLSGLRRFSSVLSYQLILILLYFLLGTVCAYIASFVFSMTPFAFSLMKVLQPLVVDGTLDIAALETLPVDTLMQAYIPMLIIYLLILIPALVFLSYNLRLTLYFIMDEPRMSGLRAIRASFSAMRGFKLKMLKLDLSFWWYYLLEAVLMVICYLDLLLPILGFDFPFDPTIAYFATLVLYCVLELLLHLWKKAQVETTYALAYRTIVKPNVSNDVSLENA